MESELFRASSFNDISDWFRDEKNSSKIFRYKNQRFSHFNFHNIETSKTANQRCWKGYIDCIVDNMPWEQVELKSILSRYKIFIINLAYDSAERFNCSIDIHRHAIIMLEKDWTSLQVMQRINDD